MLILETNYNYIQANINGNLDLSLIVCFLVQRLQKKHTIFITTNELIDATYMLINGKLNGKLA